MKYGHTYGTVALIEYQEAVEWYKYRSLVAAENFVKVISEAIASIGKDPEKFRNVYDVFREMSLKKYPNTIVYFVDKRNRKIIITSVFHNKRDPAKKYRK